MEFRTYGQVDPYDVLRLNMLALDFPFTPQAAAALRQHDRRFSEGLAVYAVVDGAVAGQVGMLTAQAETVAGPVTVGAVWAVATLPAFGRRGIARALMERAEEELRAMGCVAVTLGTSRSRVAHRLYQSMGYEDILPVQRAFCFAEAVAAPSITVRPAAAGDLE
ncbi:MAG TPA: GNAT family N-acetyltransferase, partial [Symbiobacteriaceae bacterium]|nr:GNAT family N-acetyltransferase [Symbiobacteriaceae bacterium]